MPDPNLLSGDDVAAYIPSAMGDSLSNWLALARMKSVTEGWSDPGHGVVPSGGFVAPSSTSMNPLRIQPPSGVPAAGAANQVQPAWGPGFVDAVTGWMAREHARSQALGLEDPETGMPTGAGLQRALMSYPNALVAGSGGGGIKAYHGSPADFSAFSNEYIGSGEGAQAYGYGHYAAGSDGTAQYYKDVLTREKGLSTVWKDRAGSTLDFADLAQGSSTDPTAAAANWMKQRSGPDAGITPALDEAIQTKPEDFAGGAAERQATIDGLTTWERQGVGQRPGGHMYEVSIDADPEHMLDWDKPLSEQSQHVQDALAAWNASQHPDQQLPTKVYGQRRAGQPLPDLVEPSGKSIYSHFSSVGGNDPAGGSQALKAAGIPGIRYLDQGSRIDPTRAEMLRQTLANLQAKNASAGAIKSVTDELDRVSNPTHNYVIFDPATIAILRKYGIAGLLAGGSAVASSPDQNQ